VQRANDLLYRRVSCSKSLHRAHGSIPALGDFEKGKTQFSNPVAPESEATTALRRAAKRAPAKAIDRAETPDSI
jgi:hypothetical protein